MNHNIFLDITCDVSPLENALGTGEVLRELVPHFEDFAHATRVVPGVVTHRRLVSVGPSVALLRYLQQVQVEAFLCGYLMGSVVRTESELEVTSVVRRQLHSDRYLRLLLILANYYPISVFSSGFVRPGLKWITQHKIYNQIINQTISFLNLLITVYPGSFFILFSGVSFGLVTSKRSFLIWVTKALVSFGKEISSDRLKRRSIFASFLYGLYRIFSRRVIINQTNVGLFMMASRRGILSEVLSRDRLARSRYSLLKIKPHYLRF